MKSYRDLKKLKRRVEHKYFQRVCRDLLSVAPKNCKHSKRGILEGVPVYFCKHPKMNSKIMICELQLDRDCPRFNLDVVYEPRFAMEHVVSTIKKFSSDNSLMIENMPDLAVVYWILGEKEFEFISFKMLIYSELKFWVQSVYFKIKTIFRRKSNARIS